MGLDVYLYRYEDYDATIAAEQEAEAFSAATWAAAGEYEKLSQEQKDATRAAVRDRNAAVGLDEWGDDKARKQKIEIDSAKYPEHYFKIGYFRSSYNAGGINSVCRDLGINDLYSVFQPGEEYQFRPDWKLARECAVEALRKLQAAPKLRVETVSNILATPTTTAAEALSIAAVQMEQQKQRPRDDDFSSYSNRDGYFYLKGFTIVAAIPGMHFNSPCTHLVYAADDELKWYEQAFEIVIETIDYVLAQPEGERSQYVLHWSS